MRHILLFSVFICSTLNSTHRGIQDSLGEKLIRATVAVRPDLEHVLNEQRFRLAHIEPGPLPWSEHSRIVEMGDLDITAPGTTERFAINMNCEGAPSIGLVLHDREITFSLWHTIEPHISDNIIRQVQYSPEWIEIKRAIRSVYRRDGMDDDRCEKSIDQAVESLLSYSHEEILRRALQLSHQDFADENDEVKAIESTLLHWVRADLVSRAMRADWQVESSLYFVVDDRSVYVLPAYVSRDADGNDLSRTYQLYIYGMDGMTVGRGGLTIVDDSTVSVEKYVRSVLSPPA